MTLQSIAKGISEQKLESSLIKSLLEKLINSVLLVVDVAQLDHAFTVQISGIARSHRLHMRYDLW